MKYPMFKVSVNVNQSLSEVERVLVSGFLNEGAEVSSFKKKFEKTFGIKNTVLTNSCTSALTMALKLSNVLPGDEVITTAMTCLATNTPILNLGAIPVWADINCETGTINPDSVLKLISKKTKAVICVNWAGNPCDLKKLLEVCNKNKIKLIQDAAHSLGSKIDDVCISNFADFTCFSFQAIKHLTTGDGGALICKNKNDYERAKPMKWFGLDRDIAKDKNGEWKGQRWELDVKEAGYKFHMNNIAAAIGLANMIDIERKIKIHKDNGKLYEAEFKENKNIKLLKMPDKSESSYWVFTILTNLDKFKRDKALELLNNAGINAGLVHTPNHFYTCFKESYKELEKVNTFSDSQISLPCGWWLNKEDILTIADKTKKIIGEIDI
jgi:perosamine synthetase